jgi:hypothetical protein
LTPCTRLDVDLLGDATDVRVRAEPLPTPREPEETDPDEPDGALVRFPYASTQYETIGFIGSVTRLVGTPDRFAVENPFLYVVGMGNDLA